MPATDIVVDSHQHFWDPSELDLPALPPELALLDKAYLPEDLAPELARVGVDYTVLVQGHPQTAEGNHWLCRKADATPYVAGVVAWAPLDDPASLGGMLDTLQAEPKFCGVRHIVEAEPDPAWILRDTVLEGLRQLAQRSIPYDMLVKPKHLTNVLTLLGRLPELPMVIDHIAKPDIAGGGSPGWAGAMAAIAEHPRVYCKLSGMITEADWHAWKPADLAASVAHVIEEFGMDRVMFGSDWPVCLLAGSYGQVWHALNDVLGNISRKDRAGIFGGNAIRFYGLDIGRAGAGVKPVRTP